MGIETAAEMELELAHRSHMLLRTDDHTSHNIAVTIEVLGCTVNHEIETDLEGAIRFIDSTRIPYQAPSLGGVESLIELPVTMSFWDYPPEVRQSYGITDSLVRFACGVESTEDIIADIDQALAQV